MIAVIDDIVVAAAAAVIVASLVVLAGFLLRYRKLVEEADKSSQLAKDIWESFNARFSVLDARIIDVMARTEVISARAVTPVVTRAMSTPSQRPSQPAAEGKTVEEPVELPASTRSVARAFGEGTETEANVLRLLAEGPKTSAQIKDILGKSREHTARLMKTLFDRGLVVRNDRNKPYLYEITKSGKSYLTS